MAAITPEEAQGYLARWRLVRENEIAELRRTSMETKVRQLSALMASRQIFGTDPDREGGAQTVRERWAYLRRSLGE
jgi:hypothetical protein